MAAEYGGIIAATLKAGDFDTSMEVYSVAYSELKGSIDDVVYEDITPSTDLSILNAELNHIIGLFKTFFDKWYDKSEFRQCNYILTRLATVFSEEIDFAAEYNKVCYLIRQNMPIAVGTEKNIFRAPEPFIPSLPQ